MSFVYETDPVAFTPNIHIDASTTPEKYLQTNHYGISPYTTIDSWFQPNRDYNYYMINSNRLSDNTKYRKYMTTHSKEIMEYNEKIYKKQIVR